MIIKIIFGLLVCEWRITEVPEKPQNKKLLGLFMQQMQKLYKYLCNLIQVISIKCYMAILGKNKKHKYMVKGVCKYLSISFSLLFTPMKIP